MCIQDVVTEKKTKVITVLPLIALDVLDEEDIYIKTISQVLRGKVYPLHICTNVFQKVTQDWVAWYGGVITAFLRKTSFATVACFYCSQQPSSLPHH